MTGLVLDLQALPRLFEPTALLQWLPGLVFAVFLLLVLRRLSPAMQRLLSKEVLTQAETSGWQVFPDLDHAVE